MWPAVATHSAMRSAQSGSPLLKISEHSQQRDVCEDGLDVGGRGGATSGLDRNNGFDESRARDGGSDSVCAGLGMHHDDGGADAVEEFRQGVDGVLSGAGERGFGVGN